MKKLIILMVITALLFFGCANEEPQIDTELIKIEITYSDSANITYDLINNSKNEIEFGSEYAIEYYDGESWVPVEERSEAFFTMMAYVLVPGEKMNFSYDMAGRYGELSDGKYRVFKDVKLLNEDGTDCGSQRVYAEFEVSVKER